MSRRVLVAYESNAGSTEEVARRIAETISANDVDVEAKRLAEIRDVGDYDAVVIGAPMIVGWHRKAIRFIRRHQERLSQISVAYFMTALRVTESKPINLEEFAGIEIYRDPSLVKEPEKTDSLSFKERHSSLNRYILPVLKKVPKVKPVAIGLFAGKLDYGKLKFLQMAFVMLLFAEKPRDYRNWDCIRSWAKRLRPKILTEIRR
jgi:menaquinone-dependent protoporphyrinogen IX oxidase